MSISLKQLSAMAGIAETLAAEMRELIALREIVAAQSARRLRAAGPICGSHRSPKLVPKPASRVLRANSGPARPPESTESADPR